VTGNVAVRDLTLTYADSERVTSTRQEMTGMEAAVKQASNQQGAVILSLLDEENSAVVSMPVFVI